MRDNRVQQHPPVRGQCGIHLPEELRIGLESEVFERTDHEHPVDFSVELLPGLKADLFGAVAGQTGEELADMFVLILADGQPDDIDVVLLYGAGQGRPPAATHVQDRHTGFEVQLAQYEVDLRHLSLFEIVVVLGKVGAGVGEGRIEEQAEEIVG